MPWSGSQTEEPVGRGERRETRPRLNSRSIEVEAKVEAKDCRRRDDDVTKDREWDGWRRLSAGARRERRKAFRVLSQTQSEQDSGRGGARGSGLGWLVEGEGECGIPDVVVVQT